MLRGSLHLGKITGHFSPTVPPSAVGYSRVVTGVETPGGENWNQDRTISLKAAVRGCINKLTPLYVQIFEVLTAVFMNIQVF
jgi:hypothetical protein